MSSIQPYYKLREASTNTLATYTLDYWIISLIWHNRATGDETVTVQKVLEMLEAIQVETPLKARVRSCAFVLQQEVILGKGLD